MLSETEKTEIRKTINNNSHEVFILSIEEMDHVIQNNVQGKNIKEQWNTYKKKIEFSASYYSSGKDIFLMSKLLADLGYAGTKAYVKYYGGKPHIILKGYPGLRKILNASKYGVQNAKVVKMGLGKHGALNAAKGGGLLTIILVSTYRVIDFFLNDATTLNQLIGTLATDVIKVGIVTGASIATATGVAALGTAFSAGAATGVVAGLIVAIGPLAAVIVVGIGVSFALSYIDDKYHLTDKIIVALDEISEKGIQGIIEEKKKNLVDKGNAILNDAADSVIDYAVEKVQRIITNNLNNFLRRLTTPQI